MADTKQSALTPRGTPSRSADTIMVVNGTSNYVSTINNELGISGNPIGDTDSQTLTNKTLTSPTISGPTLSGTVLGTYTLGGTVTFPTSVVTLTGTQTLTNKTLTSPTINAPTITNMSATQDAVVGFTTANTGTVYGVSITGGFLSTTALATNAVQANQLAANAITLGYAQITSNFTTTSTTPVQITGLTLTVTIPAGNRRIKITSFACSVGSSGVSQLTVWDGTVGSGTQLQFSNTNTGSSNSLSIFSVVTPAAGTKTYNIGLLTTAGTATFAAGSVNPAFILVEAI